MTDEKDAGSIFFLDVSEPPQLPTSELLKLHRCIARLAHIPLSELQSRLYELPPKQVGFEVFDKETLAALPSPPVELGNKEGKDGQPTKPTKTEAELAVELLQRQGWNCRLFSAFSCPATAMIEAAIKPVLRLWTPSDFLEQQIDAIESSLTLHLPLNASPNNIATVETTSSTVPKHTKCSLRGKGFVALDIGCGCGRDAAFLSQRGWAVIGIENRTKLLTQAMELSRRQTQKQQSHAALCGYTDTLLHEVTDVGIAPLRPSSFDLVVLVRFLHRPSLPTLPTMIRPGGFLLYSHFVDGVQLVGTPKDEKAYLKHDELLRMWITGDDGGDKKGNKDAKETQSPKPFKMIIHYETTLPDGRPIVNFLMQRV